MASSVAAADAPSEPIGVARRHAMLRFGVGVAAALIISEAMGWAPTFLAPVLLAVLLTSLPFVPPLKMGLGLVVVMAGAALVSFILPSLLRGTPFIMAGAIALILFLAFVTMAQGRAKFPATLLLLCISTVPVVVMTAPAQAGIFPQALVRAMAVAILILWAMYAMWPRVMPRAAPPPTAPIASPVARALVGTAVVMPVMLVHLMYGLANALPVLVTTVLLVATFDPRQGAMQGFAMVFGNLIGGLIALIAFMMLAMAPSLLTLALLTFLIATAFAIRIDKGGPGAAIALLTCNSSLIILSSAIASGPANSGIWLTRLLQFVLASLFAIGMMSLVWGNKTAADR